MADDRFLKDREKLLGRRIKLLRIEAGFNTQSAFATAFTGSDKKTSILSRIENGSNLQFTTIVRLAAILNVSLLNVFDFKGIHSIKRIGDSLNLEDRVQYELKLLGQRIKYIRKKKDFVQLDLDVISMIDRGNISNYEKGRENLKFHTIVMIAKGLGIEIWELFDYNGKYSEI